ncbi:MAG: efflux RND transporter periplasmic adaptor subunit [Chitinophagaceae bacterium]|nr:MAG: efflux RND transporter periplasmic adaptor subunit [Chitinophagaceae bacterium]
MSQTINQTSPRLAAFIRRSQLYSFGIFILSIFLYACTNSSASDAVPPAPQSLPVITLNNQSATTFQEFTASLEGSQDIEIRAQVDGYLDRILVDEGAYVKKGQPLFQINARPYQEQLNNARASLASAQANLTNASINVSKLTPLVQNNIVSDVQLKTAKSGYDAAAAQVSQAQSMVEAASINLGYTRILAPVEGYVGRIPFRTGSLVGLSTPNALTVVSSVREIYAYFSFSEKDFLSFTHQFDGASIEEKIKHIPEVELVLADETIYPVKGKVETVSGQYNEHSGTISFRAAFENRDGLLRSGNSGRVRIPRQLDNTFIVPQETTFEMQDKVFVFAVSDSNKVSSVPLHIVGRSGNYYFVDNGFHKGERIVYAGIDRLKDGTVIQPTPLSLDSLIKTRPL